MREFKLIKNPNDCGNLYYRNIATLEPGVTVLIGCNGCGKTTMLQQIKNQLEREEIPYVYYDNLIDGGSRAREKAGFYGDVEFLTQSLCSSEGENIVLNIHNVAREMGSLVRNNSESNELWFLFDALDSGLSVDNIVDIKKYLFKTVFEHSPTKDIYIVLSANEFELARGEKCFDTYLCKYIEIKSYDEYREFILKSRERKDKREYTWAKRQKKDHKS